MAPRWLLIAAFVGMAVAACGDDEGIQTGGDSGPGDDDAGSESPAAGGGGRAGAPVSGRGGVGGAGMSGRGGAGYMARPTDCATAQDGGSLEAWCSRISEAGCDLSLSERREELCRNANDEVVEGPNSCGGTTLRVVRQLYGGTYHFDAQDNLIGFVRGGHGCIEENGAIPGIDYQRFYGERCTSEFEKTRPVDCSALDLDAGI